LELADKEAVCPQLIETLLAVGSEGVLAVTVTGINDDAQPATV
jgi:hypothetical protein